MSDTSVDIQLLQPTGTPGSAHEYAYQNSYEVTSQQLIMHSGNVYNTFDPYATALAITDTNTSWIGSDEAASTMRGKHSDLAGHFLAPGFVSLIDLRDTDYASLRAWDMFHQGIMTAHVLGEAEAVKQFINDCPQGMDVTSYSLVSLYEITGGKPASHTEPGLIFVADTPEAATEFFDLWERLDKPRAAFPGLRLYVPQVISQSDIPRCASAGLPVSCRPDKVSLPLADYSSAGIPLSFALAPQNPWKTVRAAVYESSQGISARAAFLAATRGGMRAAGYGHLGMISMGLPARLAEWSCTTLSVQTPDSRIATWSTDPRSRIPQLPDLKSKHDLPQLIRLWTTAT